VTGRDTQAVRLQGESAEPVLTLLYVPGDRPDRVQKALASVADVVIVDFEDAVAPTAKATAREVLGSLSPEDCRRVQVRINPVGTPWHVDDLGAVADLVNRVGVDDGQAPLAGLRVPKSRTVEDVTELARRLPGVPLHLLLEDALGVERAFDLATSHHQVGSIGLGEADLRSDLGVADDDGLVWCRSRVVVAARAAGLVAPAMSVFPQVKDLAGLSMSCLVGKGLGFLGRAAIHPAQLPVIEEAFAPTVTEVERATEVVQRVQTAAAAGAGTVVLDDGSFLDVAMVRAAEDTLRVARRVATREGG
jgi:citrate lyase subunit beta/citryl-CoA lyase